MNFQYHTILKIISFLMLSLTLTSCNDNDDTPDRTTVYGRATYDAMVIEHQAHIDYLKCYPLAPAEKAECTEKMADKYIKEQLEKEHQIYKTAFQYEAERLGFKDFLINKGISCSSISDSPLYDNKMEAYKVVCNPDEVYYMSFDYNTKEWRIKEYSKK